MCCQVNCCKDCRLLHILRDQMTNSCDLFLLVQWLAGSAPKGINTINSLTCMNKLPEGDDVSERLQFALNNLMRQQPHTLNSKTHSM